LLVNQARAQSFSRVDKKNGVGYFERRTLKEEMFSSMDDPGSNRAVKMMSSSGHGDLALRTGLTAPHSA
jgi:hypothetical protein